MCSSDSCMCVVQYTITIVDVVVDTLNLGILADKIHVSFCTGTVDVQMIARVVLSAEGNL